MSEPTNPRPMAIVDIDGNIVNTVIWDGVAPWQPLDPTYAIMDDPQVCPGWVYTSATRTWGPGVAKTVPVTMQGAIEAVVNGVTIVLPINLG